MCAQGVKLNTTQNLKIGANQDADTLVCGWNNEITLIEKTDMVVGARAEGTAAVKAEVVVGAALSAVGGLRADMTLGYQYARSPMGSMEEVGGYIDRKNYHVSTVGTAFFVGAGATATIHSPDIQLTASAPVAATPLIPAVPYSPAVLVPGSLAIMTPEVLATPEVPAVPASTATSNLILKSNFATLMGGENTETNKTPASLSLNQTGAILEGITAGNLVSILEAALTIIHATSVSLGTSDLNNLIANASGMTITGTPQTIINGTGGVNINGSMIKVGEPVVTNATFATQLAQAQAQAAAAAAVAATAAAYPSLADID
jgi:hypothetical protein